MRVGLAVAVCGVVLLAGCSGGAFNSLDQAAATGGVAGARLAGVVHGGQQPIVGSHVYLFAANTTGYGGAGIAASSSNASVSLLTAGSGTSLDSSGGATNGDYYVTTDGSGNFSISGDYTCTAGQQVYLYALGGNPGIGANAAIGLMAMLGNCPAAGNFAAATPYVVMNEVSTVAAAYAMAGFATDATHVSSSGTALAQVGIANAFANAGNLVTLSTGTALTTTPAGNGAVPQAEINTLGNILAACVNWSPPGTGYSPCATLFFYGGNGLTTPDDTAAVAINIAHNPGANMAGLYGLASATPPFAPTLSTQPADWTVAIALTGGGLSTPNGIAIDGTGDAWVASTGSNSVVELSSSGAFLSGTGGFSGGGMLVPRYIAVDPLGDAWITGSANVVEFSATGGLLSGASGYTGTNSFGGNSLSGPSGIAIDNSGNVWVPASSGNFGVSEFTNTGSFVQWINGGTYGMSVPEGVAADGSGHIWVASFGNNFVFESGFGGASGGGLDEPSQVAIDASGDGWLTNVAGNSLTEISSTGTPLTGSSGFSGGGLGDPQGIAIDGGGNVWVGSYNSKSLIEFSNSGTVLSGANGYQGGTSTYPVRVAVDGSGNAWTTTSSGAVSEIIGVGVPVVTPLSVGAANNRLGTRP